MPEFSPADILRILPQSYPFLLIDKILELEPLKKVVALKNISINEAYFQGHFKDRPLMPGVLIIEAMAQAAIVLFWQEAGSEKKITPYLGSVKVRFLQPVFPGDQLKITVVPLKLLSGLAMVSAQAVVADKEVARGELSFSLKTD
jgi:beta-hydroxyacyl-ACP dehydratase FabZ